MLQVSPEQVRWFRLKRSGLVDRFATAPDAAHALVGVQAQIASAAAIALFNRVETLPTEAEVARHLYERRDLVTLWGQRGTLHYYAIDDWPVVHGMLDGAATWWEQQVVKKAAKSGDPDSATAVLAAYNRNVDEVAALLREQRVMGREALRASGLSLYDGAYSSWGGVFADLVRRGHACHVGKEGGETRYAAREHWAPDLKWTPPDSQTAHVDATHRYLRAYGPARQKDVAYWRGGRVRDVKRWWKDMAEELVPVQIGDDALRPDKAYHVLESDVEELLQSPPKSWPVQVLYRFDPLLLALEDKSWLIAPEQRRRVWITGGHIEGVILDKGRIVSTWRFKRGAGPLTITLDPHQHLSKRVTDQANIRFDAIAHFLEHDGIVVQQKK